MRPEPKPVEAEPRPDPRTRAILQELKVRLRKRFGDRIVGLYLFGSRARGDHEPDSDADVAVIFKGRIGDRFDLQRQIIEDTYELLLEHGLYIQPWPLEEGCLEDPDAHPRPHLARAVLREGIRL
jgi:antitoxin ChpS